MKKIYRLDEMEFKRKLMDLYNDEVLTPHMVMETLSEYLEELSWP